MTPNACSITPQSDGKNAHTPHFRSGCASPAMSRVLLLLAAIAFLGGCARQADVSKTKHFQNRGITFDYPQNWRITKDEQNESFSLIYVEGPGSVLTILSVFNADMDISLEKYTADFIESMRLGVPLNWFKLTSTSAKPEMTDVRFSIRIGDIDTPITANLSKREMGGLQVICLTQEADEDRHLVQAGFDLIRQSLASSPAAIPGK